MKIAVIVERDLVGSGFATRVASMIEYYALQGHRVDLFQIGASSNAIPDGLSRTLNSYYNIPIAGGRVRSHLGIRPSRLVRCEQAFVQSKVRSELAVVYDVVQAETVNVWGVATRINGRKRVLVFHDDDAARLGSLVRIMPNSLRRLLHCSDAMKYRYWQRRCAAEADQCWFVSDSELKRFTADNSRTMVLVPNGAPDQLYSIPSLPESTSRRLVFVGPYGYDANRQGVEWFLKAVWPRILNVLPDAQLRLIGSGWQEVGFADSFRNVVTLGLVADLSAEMAQAAVVIAPLFAGGGTNIKVLEAMAAARPVVATQFGARGIPESPGLVVTDDPLEYAQKTVELLSQVQYASSLGMTNRSSTEHMKWSRIWSDALIHLEAVTNG